MSRAARPDVAAAAKVVPVLDQIFLPARQGFCASPPNRVVPEQTSQTLVESGVTVPPGPATLIVERPKAPYTAFGRSTRSEEHTSELQSRLHLVCRLLLEKKKKKHID